MRLARRATGRDRRRLVRWRLPRPHGRRHLGGGPRQVPGARPPERSRPPHRALQRPRRARGGARRPRRGRLPRADPEHGRRDAGRSRTTCGASRRPATAAARSSIYDEVQTGFGRTGTFFYAGKHGVMPDLVTLAKGIGERLPDGRGARLRRRSPRTSSTTSTGRRSAAGRSPAPRPRPPSASSRRKTCSTDVRDGSTALAAGPARDRRRSARCGARGTCSASRSTGPASPCARRCSRAASSSAAATCRTRPAAPAAARPDRRGDRPLPLRLPGDRAMRHLL